MRKKRSILPSFTVLALTAVLLVLSCSHGGGSGSDDEGGQVSEADDNQASQSDAPADTSDNSTGDDGLTPPSKDEASAKANDDALTELESTVSDPKTPPGGDADLNTDAASNNGSGSTPSPDPATTASDKGFTTQADQTAPPTTADATPPPSPETAPPPAVEPLPPPAPTELPPVADASKPKHHGHKHHKSQSTEPKTAGRRGIEAPKIPGSAISKKGSNLNRFYFARKGDNPKQLSQLLYGNADHEKDLVEWNGSNWKPGSLIFYSSPIDANDTKMQAFYQERNVPVEEYAVETDDTVFSIAEKKLGDKRSWKEIAAINGMENSNGIEAGQKLALYAADLSQFTPDKAAAAVAQNTPPKPDANAATPPTPPPPAEVAPPVPPIEPPPPSPKPFSPPPQHSNGFDVAQLIQQNIIAVGIGGIILVLLVTLMALNRKKKAGQEDFGDENFNSPRARRK
jgi:hypothetical protein